jgi:hypothetical protein
MNHKVKTVRKILAAMIVLIAFAGFTSCEKFGIPPIPFDPLATWSFQKDVQAIFTSDKCIDCHNGSRSPDLRAGKSYLALTKGGYVNAPAASSRLYLKITSSSHSSRTTDNEKLIILNWIKQGALNN